MNPKIIKLVSITEYANHWGIDRKTVYKYIEDEKITRYEDSDGNPMLNATERPRGVKKYGDIRKRKIV